MWEQEKESQEIEDTTTKFDIKNVFEGKYFGLWRINMETFLIQKKSCSHALRGEANMPTYMSKN